MCSALDNILKSRMCDPQVRFCERRRGASPFAYLILPRYFGHMERSDFMCYATSVFS